MLSGVCVGTDDLSTAARFYDAVLLTIGMHCTFSEDRERAYAGRDGRTTFFVLVPYDDGPATGGNGTQVMFYAPNEAAVRAFHETALREGGTDAGAPDPRDYHPNYYGAYVLDLDGNKLNVSVSLEQ